MSGAADYSVSNDDSTEIVDWAFYKTPRIPRHQVHPHTALEKSMANALFYADERGYSSIEPRSVQGDEMNPVQSAVVLHHLNDEVNRCFLELLSHKWRTAQELTAICETPISTTYRKLNDLEDAGLLKQRIRVSDDGKHPEEFRSRSMELTFRVDTITGVDVTISLVDEPTDGE